MIPLSLPPVRTPKLFIPAQTPGFGFELDQIKSPPPGGTGTPSTGLGPFDLEFSPGGSPGDLTPFMRPGTVNSVIPSNYLSLPDISDTGAYYFVLSVTTLDGQIATASVALNGSPPAGIPVAMGVPPTAFDYLIGAVVDGVWFRAAPTGSLDAIPFETFRTGIINPTPGTLPYDIWYSWYLE